MFGVEAFTGHSEMDLGLSHPDLICISLFKKKKKEACSERTRGQLDPFRIDLVWSDPDPVRSE